MDNGLDILTSFLVRTKSQIDFILLKEMCTHMYIVAERLRRRSLFLYWGHMWTISEDVTRLILMYIYSTSAKQIRGGRLSERRRLLSTVLNIWLFKRVSSCSVPSRFVPKFSPFVLSLSRFVLEMLHVRVHEQISVVRPFPRTTSKWSKVSKIQAKFCCVYLWLP